VEIGRVLASDLDAIGKLHAHFWDEVSDVDAMSKRVRPNCIGQSNSCNSCSSWSERCVPNHPLDVWGTTWRVAASRFPR